METSKLDTNKLILERSPIVVVMGHVDHGKTTLLDYIKKTTIAAREAGGITQSIGAYEVWHQPQINADQQSAQIGADKKQRESAASSGKRITFIDTPGHEAFTKMRARGATVADFAILVVAADDGVKPQTKEVISILNETKTPFIVAINKIDKNNADIERVKNELSQVGVLLEGYGGSVSWHGISAKAGEGVNDLLDLILLAAEVEGLVYDPAAPASGVIIEAELDNRRGIIVSAVLRNGILRPGSYIATASARGKVKILENFKGDRVSELTPSSPALIVGFEVLPEVGEEFTTSSSRIGTNAATNSTNGRHIRGISGSISVDSRAGADSRDILNVFVKADVAGSLEAMVEILKTTDGVRITEQAVGEITDGDVKNASAQGAVIVGFRTGPTKVAESVAKAQGVDIVSSEIIYELLKSVEEKVEAKKSPPPEGELEILAIFSAKGTKQVVGGKVMAGRIKNKSDLAVLRSGGEIGRGRILNLQQGKKDVFVVNAPDECGIMFESNVAIAVGDHLLAPAP